MDAVSRARALDAQATLLYERCLKGEADCDSLLAAIAACAAEATKLAAAAEATAAAKDTAGYARQIRSTHVIAVWTVRAAKTA